VRQSSCWQRLPPPCAMQKPVSVRAALFLAPPAPAVRDAVERAALSSSEAVLVLAALAPAMRLAVPRDDVNSLLGTALLLTRPPAHGTPRWLPLKPYSSAPVTHPPLSPQRSTSAHRTQHTRRWQCESRSDVGFSMSRSRWSTALGRGTHGGCVVGQDGQGLLRTLHRQVRRLLALLQT
jgi:hypothetical protein